MPDKPIKTKPIDPAKVIAGLDPTRDSYFCSFGNSPCEMCIREGKSEEESSDCEVFVYFDNIRFRMVFECEGGDHDFTIEGYWEVSELLDEAFCTLFGYPMSKADIIELAKKSTYHKPESNQTPN
jgi:hypothetical protein